MSVMNAPCRRYRLEKVSWMVVREGWQPSLRALSKPEAVAELAKDLVRGQDDDREHFWAVFVNAKNHYQSHHEASTGTLSASLVHPREVFGPALREGAAAVILIHNHPSGDPTPSREDVRLTRQLVEGGRLLDVRVLDHIIVGNGSEGWVSMASRGEV